MKRGLRPLFYIQGGSEERTLGLGLFQSHSHPVYFVILNMYIYIMVYVMLSP